MAVDRELEAVIATNRFGLGARPGEIAAARNDPRGWLKGQIRRQGADQPTDVNGAPLPDVRHSLTMAGEAGKAVQAAVAAASSSMARGQAPAARPPANGAMAGAMAGGGQNDTERMLARVRSQANTPFVAMTQAEILARTRLGSTTPASFRERWALFWANHFTAAGKNPPMYAMAGPFEREAIRPNVFGKFHDLLVASSGHPAMLFYLDQVASTGPNSIIGKRGSRGLNENLAREIMELHTLGADGGYTQADVTEFARALTGRGMAYLGAPPDQIGSPVYHANMHEPGPRKVLGKTYPASQGDEQAMAILADLAANPATARHCCRQIAMHFIADNPPPALTAKLEAAWRASGGDLSAVAAALVDAPEFWTPQPAKFKTPNDLLLSSYRAVGATPKDSRREVDGPLTQLGQRIFSAPQPNGWSDVAGDWAAPDAMIKRVSWARAFGGHYAPGGAPQDIAKSALGPRLTDKTTAAMGRAESRPEAIALLLMSPEFQRR